jgi:gluconolactonase
MTPQLSSVATLLLLGSFLAPVSSSEIPPQAQLIDQRAFNVLPATQPPAEFNAKSVCDSSFAVSSGVSY